MSVASETCAFDAIDAEFVRDIAPGEIVTIEAARDGGDGYFMTEDTYNILLINELQFT